MDDDDLLGYITRGRVEHSVTSYREARAAWLAFPTGGYLLTFSGPAKTRPHIFCGANRIPGADCPNCRKPLLRLLTLDSAKLPFSIAPASLHLLYCWTCAIPFDPFSYRVAADGSVEVIRYLDSFNDAFGPDGPYNGYTGVFPESRVGLRELTADEQELALNLRANGKRNKKLFYLTEPVHQIGGFPMIYNPVDRVTCPKCAMPSPFFATICDNAVGQNFQPDEKLSFAGNCGVQMVFHYCAPCSVVTAYHSCD